MKFNNITLFALCISIAILVFSILFHSGLFPNTNFVKFGYEEEYIGSQTIVLAPLQSTLLSLMNGMFYISFVLFLWMFKSDMTNKVIYNVALTVWCCAALVTLSGSMLHIYAGWVYSGQEIVSNTESYWHEEGIAQYPLLYMLLFNKFFCVGNSIFVLMNSILWISAYVLLIPVFISIKKMNKMLGTIGLLSSVVSLLFGIHRFFPILILSTPVYWIQNVCWIITFAIALKEYRNSRIYININKNTL